MGRRFRTGRATLAAALAIHGAGWGLSAQEGALSPSGTGGAAVFSGGVAPAAVDAIRRVGELSIDGRLDDPAWQPAPIITDFVQGVPVEGAEPSEPTEVRVVFDDDAIYVAARMYERDPRLIRARLTRRDERGSFDSFKLSLDPNRDGLTGYEFEVSAAGAETDRYLFGDTQEDTNWDAIWDSGVRIDDRGWTVEMRIPLSQIPLRGPSRRADVGHQLRAPPPGNERDELLRPPVPHRPRAREPVRHDRRAPPPPLQPACRGATLRRVAIPHRPQPGGQSVVRRHRDGAARRGST